MLEVTDLECVRGDRRLFTAMNFSLQPGELLHVHGPNGSGKTSLLRTVCRLMEPAAGEIRWCGSPVRALAEDYLAQLLYLGHLNGLKDELSGQENLAINATLAGSRITPQQTQQALRRMGLDGYDDLPVKLLSQGQKRRVALARLLLNGAKLWILDEPFTALDSVAVKTLQAILAGHLDSGGMVILTTHQEFAIDAGRVKRIHLGA
ncbi:MAG: heme ABC transporter ATP-binding protein CcmA [Gammaproteobacteria bacterium]|nr:MAG: heme ABC transporter ATP-binding protein CcmA [Gammaproteobacteria bacterium]TND06215.1 MAG: heme ABC transporter ATP-binding protein CcmA [Gammaproteobacteria bacterium]